REKLSAAEVLLAEAKACCPASEEEVLRLQEGLERGKKYISDVERCEQEIAQAMAQVGAVAELNDQRVLDFQVAEGGLQAAQSGVETARRELEASQLRRQQLEQQIIQMERQNLAVVLAEGLREGQGCPVCGSLQHPQPACKLEQNSTGGISLARCREEAEQALAVEARAMAAHTQAQEELQQATIQLAQAQHQLKAAAEQLGEMRRLQGEREKAQLRARSQLSDKIREKSLAELYAELEQLEGRLKAARESRLTWQQKLESLQQQVDKCREQVYNQEKQAAALTNARENAGKAVNEAEETVVNLKALADKKLAELERGTGRLKLPHTALEAEAARIAEMDREAAANLEEQRHLEGELKGIQERLAAIVAGATAVEIDLTGIQTEFRSLEHQVVAKEHQLHAITGGRAASQLIREKQALQAELSQAQERAGCLLEDLRARREAAGQRLTAAAKERELVLNNLSSAQGKLFNLLQKANFQSAGEAAAALCSGEERQQLAQSIKNFREREALIRQEMVRLEGRLAGHTITEEEWQQLLAEKEQGEAAYSQAAKEVGLVSGQLADLEAKHKRWQQLAEEKKGLLELKERLEMLQRVFRGNAFVEYMAEEQVINVARAASERLRQMTRHRYALEVDSEGGFIMRDDANGGVRRPVSTLSGGETFLTSLALALALSAQIQLKGQFPLEFFFLDEGFGTLDPELLDKVMGTLEQLPADRMTIGVISHVPEMRQRMARRLVVEPAQPGESGSRVNFETS
ncbi:MAG TPA: SbcC/MukB-like Walker B domain-containing protein, partial [Bacillota bacterium]|nr:SbcC/MukB-like Walker B domain-containing protein [Bacillota bacterium]